MDCESVLGVLEIQRENRLNIAGEEKRRCAMGFLDRLRHEGQTLAGGAKRGAGRMRGDKPQENAGKRHQRATEFKKAGDHLKSAFKKK
jgi:uncharacterized protein YjbJ (UPF0337 family)